MNYKVKIKGEEITIEFRPDDEIKAYDEVHFPPDIHGSLDLVKKVKGVPAGEVVFKNGNFSFIKNRKEPAFIVDCRDYKKICFIADIQELRLSEPEPSIH